jgi:hypothetical protein
MTQQLPRMLDTYVSQPDIVFVGRDNELNLFVDIQHRCGRFLAPCKSYLVGFERGGAVADRAATSKTASWGHALLRVLFNPVSFDSFGALHDAADSFQKGSRV